MRKCNHVATKKEIVSILRRFDLDGDAKINFKEFETAIKSTISSYPATKR